MRSKRIRFPPRIISFSQSLKCTARLTNDGRSYVLDGNKLWITNGGIADLVTVFARTPFIALATK